MRSLQIKPLHLCVATALVFPLQVTAQSPATIGELFASETTAHGPVLLAGTGMSVVSGSQLSAGKSVATLRLERGGEVRICPNASITVSAPQNNSAQNSQELMMAMDTGSVELDYPVNDVADTLITPDFKLMLAGPGVFHFALGVNSRGDTCIKPMRGNSASVIFEEMVGTRFYQVRPDETILFVGGKIDGRTALTGDCGCPKPPPVMQAEEQKPTPPQAGANGPTPIKPKPAPENQEAVNVTPPSIGTDAVTPAPAEKTEPQHVQVETPLIFRGDVAVQPAYMVARIRFSALPNVFLAQENEKPTVLKPGKGEVSPKSRGKKGFLGRIKGFFAALFGK